MITRHKSYVVETNPDPKYNREEDMAQCGHCTLQMHLPPAKDGRVIVPVSATCKGCGRFLCNVCHGKGGCDVWEKKFERMEARERMLKSIGV